MKIITKEFLVGCLVLFAIGLMLVFGWLMGVVGPLTKEMQYYVLYGFAGGVEIGSPVRVSGVKVGKVEKIEFISPVAAEKGSERVTLKVTIGISQRAAKTVRQDSKFFVNMAGIIGERYIEVSPGSAESPELANLSSVRGIDPPRIDQLLSQGYSVFGRVQEFLEDNEATVSDFLVQMHQLLADANKLLKGQDRKKLIALVDNLNDLTVEMKEVTRKIQDPEAKKTFEQLEEIIRRAHEIDKPALKEFLQEEGIRARIF